MYKKIIFFMAVLSFLCSACSLREKSDKLKVTATIFPVYDFARTIGGNKINLSILISPGVEVHHFEPKPKDISKIAKSDIFIYSSDIMEPWAEKFAKSFGKNIFLLNASEKIKFKPLPHKKDKKHSSLDPHIWLNFENAKTMIDNIASGFIRKDKKNKNFYLKNAKAFKNKISELDKKFAKKLSVCKNRKIIYLGHFAFGYLAERYNLEYIRAQGFTSGAEPSPKDIIDLIKIIKADNIKFIFTEPLINPRFANMVAKEAGCSVLELNPIGEISKKSFKTDPNYISLMEGNLKNILKGLKCKN